MIAVIHGEHEDFTAFVYLLFFRVDFIEVCEGVDLMPSYDSNTFVI